MEGLAMNLRRSKILLAALATMTALSCSDHALRRTAPGERTDEGRTPNALERAVRMRPAASRVAPRSLESRGETYSARRGPTGSPEVELPSRSQGRVRVRDETSGIELGFWLRGAESRGAEASESALVFSRALANADWIQSATRDGVEDCVLFDVRPERAELTYGVDVTKAAGVRFVGGALELLDAGGVPRLRMSAPYAVDASGATHALSIAVDGCHVDRDPRAPFGRPVVAPNSPSCNVTVSWRDAGVVYPLLVDPAWTQTGTMLQPRRQHSSARLPSGKVLVSMGGVGSAINKSSEIYDPASGTWAATADMLADHVQGTMLALGSGKVLGFGGPPAAAELYDESTGKWTATGSLANARLTYSRGIVLANGKVLVAGGAIGSGGGTGEHTAELYDPVAETWSAAGALSGPRALNALVQLDDGRVIVAGGQQGEFPTVKLGSAEVWSASTNSWTALPSMSELRDVVMGVKLGDGRVLIAGGRRDALPQEQKTSEIFDPSSNSWSAGPSFNLGRYGYRADKLLDGRVLFSGSQPDGSAASQGSELLDANATAFVNAGNFKVEWRDDHSTTLLTDGRVLLSGGNNVTASSELWSPVANGGTCTVGGECASGVCVGGMCCSSACSGACQSCTGSKTGQANGTCAPIVAGTDPDSECNKCQACNGSGACGPIATGTDPKNECKDTGSPSCQEDGFCDGAGACETYSSSAGCTPNACTSGSQCASGYCADGICCDKACNGACEACTAAKKGSGVDGVCQPVSADTDPDDECPIGSGFPTSCGADGMCDGNGQCRQFAKDTVSCGATQCISGNAQGLLCNGAGQCLQATKGCEPYICANDQCLQGCTDANDCAAGNYCSSQGACLKKQTNGSACSAGQECTSAFCVDGYCCDQACGGQCEACNVAPNEGTCSPVHGPPVGQRPECAGGNECAGICDGVNTTACVVPPSGEPCGTASCQSAKLSHGECDGKGSCVDKSQDCAPFACSSDACATSCKADSDCAQGFGCDPATSNCVPTSGKCAADGVTLETSTGETKNCSPYRCQGGECNDPCATSSQCISGYACKSGKCVSIGGSDPGDSGGCGCRASDRGRPGVGMAWLLALALAAGARRKRRGACAGA
jgi:MYXO-CTERM domain-containing protein